MHRPTYAVAVDLYPGSAHIWQAVLSVPTQGLRVACELSPRAAAFRVLRQWRKDERAYRRFLSVNTPEAMARFEEQCNAL